MKKLVSLVVALFILCSTAILPVFAAGSTMITLAPSSSTIRIGDTVTITGNFNGSMVGTFDIKIKYNAAQLTFVSAEGISPAIKAGEMDVNPSSGSIQLLYLDADGGTTGITTGGAFKVKFTVAGVAVGTAVSVSAEITTVGDSAAGAMSASANPASMTIAAPLSGNTFLSGLTVSNGTLAPAFSKSVFAYTVSVPFSVEKLNVTATAEDATSTVAVNSPALAPGAATDVTVTVTAQSGAKKAYVIRATREKDPNYKAGSNANLKSLVPSLGILSPAFSPAVTSYVVYLPFEITSFNATAEMEDAKALGATGTEIQLKAGENTFTMTGKAEDGTEKIYTIKVNRMPQAGGSAPDSSSSVSSTSGTEDFLITISGILTDDKGNPLSGMTMELHSSPQVTTTDAIGFYRFEAVAAGDHTLYIKDTTGKELAQMAFIIAKGEQTSLVNNTVTAKGNTTMDLSLKNNESLTLKNVAETAIISPSVGPKGVPVFLAILLILAGIILGGAAGYFLMRKGVQKHSID